LSSRLLSKNVKIEVHKTIILPVGLYGYEIRALILREEYSLKMFENRVLMRIFGPKWDKMIGSRRMLHNVEQHNLHSSSNIFRMVRSRTKRWAWHVALMGTRRLHIGFLWKNRKERDHLEYLNICGRTILIWIFE
jgi:hypothetical protein